MKSSSSLFGRIVGRSGSNSHILLWAVAVAAAVVAAPQARATTTTDQVTPFAVGQPVAGTAFVRRQNGKSDHDTLRYYSAPSQEGPRPLLVMIQGSGCEPLFVQDAKGLQATAGQDIVQQIGSGRYAIVIMEKPHVASEGRAGSDGTTGRCSAAFNRAHSLEAWSRTLTRAVDAALRDPAVDRSAGVRLIGLSEGAVVAARLAAMRKDVSHVGFISGFGCDQWRDVLTVARRNAANANEAERAAEQAQRGLAAVAAAPLATDRQFDGQTHLFWSTFGRACPATDLANSQAKVFVAFGTADEQIDSNGVEAITASLLAARREHRVRRIFGGSHILDAPGSQPYANLLSVFAEMLDWMAL